MRKLIFFLILIPSSLNSQVDLINPPWEIGCDSLQTQTDLNICSYKSYKIADSVMLDFYEFILMKYQSDIQELSLNDEYALQLEETKKILIQSQELFIEYKNKVLELVRVHYKNGTIQSLAVNSYGIGLIEDRIKVLNNIWEEMFR